MLLLIFCSILLEIVDKFISLAYQPVPTHTAVAHSRAGRSLREHPAHSTLCAPRAQRIVCVAPALLSTCSRDLAPLTRRWPWQSPVTAEGEGTFP